MKQIWLFALPLITLQISKSSRTYRGSLSLEAHGPIGSNYVRPNDLDVCTHTRDFEPPAARS